jgi:hypothetical protein
MVGIITDENESLYEFPIVEYLLRIEIIAERIIAFLIKSPQLKKNALDYEEYFPHRFKEIFKIIKNISSAKEIDRNNLVKLNLDEEISEKINQLGLRADYETELLEKFNVSLKDELDKELKELKKESIKQQMSEIESKIRNAEKDNDKKSLEELMKKFNQLSKQLLN